MPKTRKSLIDRLDAAAERTGIPSLALGRARRRHLRWLPVVAILVAGAGFAFGLVRRELSEAGFALVMLGFAVAIMLPILGPLKPWGSPGCVDEFDRAARGKAFLVAFASISVAALLGIWLLMGLALLEHWSAIDLVLQLRTLSFLLMVLYSAVPTLHASWATDPIGED